MLETLIWVGGFTLAVLIAGVVWFFRSMSKSVEETRRSIESLQNRMTEKFPGYRDLTAVGDKDTLAIINERNRSVLIGFSDGVAKEFAFDDFTGIELLTDEYAAATTKRGDGVGRAIVGGIVAGGVGAVVGALTTKSVQESINMVSSVGVAVTTRDEKLPRIYWRFYPLDQSKDPIKADSADFILVAATRFYNHWEPVFKLIPDEDKGLVAI